MPLSSGYGKQIASHIREHSEAEFTNRYCSDFYQTVMEELEKDA